MNMSPNQYIYFSLNHNKMFWSPFFCGSPDGQNSKIARRDYIFNGWAN